MSYNLQPYNSNSVLLEGVGLLSPLITSQTRTRNPLSLSLNLKPEGPNTQYLSMRSLGNVSDLEGKAFYVTSSFLGNTMVPYQRTITKPKRNCTRGLGEGLHAHKPRASRYITIMELGPTNHVLEGIMGPNTLIFQ